MSRLLPLLVAAGAPLAFRPAAWADSRVEVAVDGRATGTPLEKVWAFHGYDEVNYTTTPAGGDLLRAIGVMHTVPPHVRTHFLLNSGDGTAALKWGSTNAYTEDAAGLPVYDWTLMDGIIDTITQARAFPLVEIGFMPQALSTHPNPYQNTSTLALNGGCFYPPTDYAKWAGLVAAWARHTLDRYPAAEATWLWELWNEPNSGYWHGSEAEFQKLYDYTEAALHGVAPGALLGGPETIGPGAWLTDFLEHCASGVNAVTGQVGTRLDLVTFHAKGGTSIVDGNVRMDLGNQLRLHRDGFTQIAAFPAYQLTPIIIGEADPDGCAACPTSSDPEDAYRTSPAYGAYVVAMMKRTLELAGRIGVNLRGLVTWAFTFPGSPYFAGYRELATNGIELPVLGVFRLLGSLDGQRLPVASSGALALDDILANGVRSAADVDALATRAGTRLQILVWNYHDDLVTAPTTPVRVTVQLPADFGPLATLTHLRVDEDHGDAFTTWIGQGRPASPTDTQRAALVAAMAPAALEATGTMDAAGGALTLDFDLPRFAVSLLTIAPGAVDGGTVIEAGIGNDGQDGGGDGLRTTPASPGCSCATARGTGTGLPLVLAFVSLWLATRVAGRARRRRRAGTPDGPSRGSRGPATGRTPG
jgi:xylan 1,4-beta-xylosidase